MTLASLLLRLMLCLALLADASTSAHAAVSMATGGLQQPVHPPTSTEAPGMHGRTARDAAASVAIASLPCHATAIEPAPGQAHRQPTTPVDPRDDAHDRGCCDATGGCECATPLAMPGVAHAALCALPGARPGTAAPASRTAHAPAFPIRPPIAAA